MNLLITGAAGFIGYHLARKLLECGHNVTGVDNLNCYYDPQLKKARLAELKPYPQFHFEKLDLANTAAVQKMFAERSFDVVVHLAAQAGVRYSLEEPLVYIQSNLVGFANLLESCRQHHIGHLVFASSSSVYGANTQQPFTVQQNVDHPLSLYAATKKSNELMAHSYAHLYQIPCTGLRFFTVYGPWGRPDMAAFKFCKNILEGKPTDVYNFGDMHRDFTYIDDIIEGMLCVIQQPAQANAQWTSSNPDPATSNAPYRIYNIGNGHPVSLTDFIAAIEQALGKKAEKNLLPLQPGDVLSTFADTKQMQTDFGFKPRTSVQQGVQQFVAWYLHYYQRMETVSHE